MKWTLIPIIPIIIFTAACASWRTTTPPPAPTIGEKVASIESETPPIKDFPNTDPGKADTPPEVAEVVTAATEVGDNPLVRWLTDPKTMADADTAMQINNFGTNNDRIGESCAKFFRSPDTLRKASELSSVKSLVDEAKAVVVVAPIQPIGPMSTIAEIRRVERDVTSGALQGRVAMLKVRLHAEKLKYDALLDDGKLACSALVLDALNAPVRDMARIAPLIAQLRVALKLPLLAGAKGMLP